MVKLVRVFAGLLIACWGLHHIPVNPQDGIGAAIIGGVLILCWVEKPYMPMGRADTEADAEQTEIS